MEEEVSEKLYAMSTRLDNNVKHVKEDVEEILEIERRKMNIVIHGVQESNTEKDIVTVTDILGKGLHMDFARHVDSVTRIGKFTEGKSRPLRLSLKSLDSKKAILSRAKGLKDEEEFLKMFISSDLTRKRQAVDKELRLQLKTFRDKGEKDARIKYGKIVKNRGGREEILFQVKI
jgi:hypothetical protein